jgi:hypothetical protein
MNIREIIIILIFVFCIILGTVSAYIGSEKNKNKFYMFGQPQQGFSVYSNGSPEGDRKAYEILRQLIEKKKI